MKNWVTIHYEDVEPALQWAKANCPTYITNAYHSMDPREFDMVRIDFFFGTSKQGRRDMTAFTLRWVR